MDEKKIYDSEIENELRERIRFKPLTLDSDLLYKKIWERICKDMPRRVGVSPVWRYVAVAAILLSIVSVSSLFFLPEKAETHLSSNYITVKAISGAKTQVVLPDSTVVWLNSHAVIRYPQQFSSNLRQVDFSGEALFEVKKDVDKPFVVDVDGLRIKVLGTIFNVHTDEGTGVVETTLLRGSVALFDPKNNREVPEVILKPNQQALFNKKNRQMGVKDVDASFFSTWKSGSFEYNSHTLQEICQSLERAFDVKIQIRSEEMKKVRLTARFNQEESLDDILEILKISAHYTYSKKGRVVYITD